MDRQMYVQYADYWNRQLCEVENSSVISMRWSIYKVYLFSVLDDFFCNTYLYIKWIEAVFE